jgi:acyl-CoA thioesterase-1
MQTVIEYFNNARLLEMKDNMKLYFAKRARAVSCAFVFLVTLFAWAAPSQAQIVALGASVVQGYGVSSGEAFPEQLQAMLRARGKQYTVTNQGVSGDTTSGVLSRLDSAVPEGTRIVILMIGGNDVRRGGSVADAQAGVGQIMSRLQARHIRVINAMPLYRAARGKGMVLPDGIHLTPAGQKYVASALAPSIN